MKKIERIIGLVLLVAIIAWGKMSLASDVLLFRLIAGLVLGYALTRGFMGFAGSVNRAYNTGSTKLMRTLAFMFFITAALSVGYLFKAEPGSYDLWVNPINLGLILGGVLFGFGMSFSSCCASGVLTDLVTGLPRALVTLVFFGMGVFVGFPLQATQTWITDSLWTTPTGEALYGGVYLPDLFTWDGTNGFLGALLLTGLLCGLVVVASYLYENKRKAANTKTTVLSEVNQENPVMEKPEKFRLFSEYTTYVLFEKPWTMITSAVVIASTFTVMMGITTAGWGASTPYGFWFGRVLHLFGMPIETITEFTMKPATPYIMPFFEHPINVQNVGIILGTIVCLLLAGSFKRDFKAELKISFRDVLLFALGGFTMGLGTRFSNGCNVGALYTPIANFSLSGWVWLIFLVIGGVIGNTVAKKLRKSC